MTQKEPVSKKEYYNIPCRIIKELDYGLHKQVEDIIDETKCEDYNNGYCKGDYYSSSVATTVSCDPKNMRCDFYVNKLEERLAHKMQECEKLKSQECENLKAEEKHLKYCCRKAGEELAKHSFDYDGKEKNLVVQAKELNEKYEKAINALDQIQHLVTKCKDEECNKCDLRYEYCTPIMKDKILKLAKEGMYDNSSNLN